MGLKTWNLKNRPFQWFKRFALYQEKRGIRWGIERLDTKELIGTIGFHALAQKHRRAEIGYEIIPEHWQNGFASEVLSKVVSYGFSALGLTRIGAVVFIANEASNRLLLKMGFQKEGVLRQYMYQNGTPYDTNVYSIVKPREWRYSLGLCHIPFPLKCPIHDLHQLWRFDSWSIPTRFSSLKTMLITFSPTHKSLYWFFFLW